MRYRCYFLDAHSKVAGVEIIEADTDSEAVARGDSVFRERGAGFSGVELWDRGRRVERKWNDGPDQIRRWRLKAEEIRTAADAFSHGSARQQLLCSAETYESLADAAEARLERRKDRKPEAG